MHLLVRTGGQMEGADRTGRIVRFGPYQIDCQARQLRRSGKRIPLQIQPLRLLELLIERAGEVVTREEVRARIWPSTIYIDFDHGLNNAMTRLRRALEESADSPRYIETLPRVGYRFIHSIECDEPGQRPAPPPLAGPPPRRAVPRGVAVWTLAVPMIALLGILLVQWVDSDRQTARTAAPAGLQSRNAAANDAYHRGVALFEQRRKESIQLSIEHLLHATEIDPDFAAAHAALAMAYTAAGGHTLVRYRDGSEVLAPALAAAERAIQLRPDLSQAHLALAGVLNHLQPWSAANDVLIEGLYQRGLKLDPTSADGHLFFGNFLATRSRSEEALRQFQLALDSRPLSPSISSRLGMELVALGYTEQGLDYLRKTVELDPWQFNAHVRLGWAYVAAGDLEQAERAFETAEGVSPGSARSLAGLALIAARRGDRARAEALLAALLRTAAPTNSPFDVAIAYVALEDRDNAIKWLARTAKETRELHMMGPWGIQSSIYDWLRDDPGFAGIERDVAATNENRWPG